MIIRWWRAIAGTDEVLTQYAEHLERTTFKEMAKLPGHLGAALAVKVNGSNNEKGAFDDAVVKPSTQALLRSFDLKVEYFETVVTSGVLADGITPLQDDT